MLFRSRFVVDFEGGQLSGLGDNPKLVPVISASRGRVEITSVRPLRSINGYRAMFDLALTEDSVEPINLRLNGVMVFFFNVFYFQYHFARIRKWKTTGVWR